MVAFEEAGTEFEAEGIATIAASTDPVERATETVKNLGVGFPVGYGLPLHETAKRLGGYYEERRGILHAAGFLVRPGGEIATLHYSSGPIGRFVPGDVLSLVKFWKTPRP